MTAVLRVKRRINEPPSDSLRLSYLAKRQRIQSTDDSEGYIAPTEMVVQFAGTIKNPNDDLTQHLAILSNTENPSRGIKRTAADSCSAAEQSSKLARTESLRDRYRVISCHPLNTLNETNSEDKWTTLVDIEDCWSTPATDQDAEKEQTIEQYVYDLYFAQTNACLEENDIEVHETVYVNDSNEIESDNDSENLDSESHPRNDYPDTEPESDCEYDREESFSEESDYLFGVSDDVNCELSNSINVLQLKLRGDTDDSSSSEEETDNDDNDDDDNDDDDDESFGIL